MRQSSRAIGLDRWWHFGVSLARSAHGWLDPEERRRLRRERRQRERPAPAAVADAPRARLAACPTGEWSLVLDARAHLTPAQFVERKLVTLLRKAPLPVSLLVRGGHSARVPGRQHHRP